MRILFQGDSVTDCCRNREQQENANQGLGLGYAFLTTAKMLAEYPEKKFEFFNRGISGNRVVDLYARWKCDALNLRPDLISILIGVNDTWHEKFYQNGVEVPRYETVYRELLRWTRESLPEVKLILIEPFILQCGENGVPTPEWEEEIAARREVVARLGKEFNIPVIKFQSVLDEACKKAEPNYWLCDGVHPAPAGHQLLSNEWIKVAESLLNLK
ncbi:MAG: SGNH/GDSL hydrolase family protein [Lentisphaeria bacterium]|nr:SGNH/GDSL hydrolase family protein [Lentisphaeria bacterium]